MLNQEILSKFVAAMAWWIVLAVPAVLIVWLLTVNAIKDKRLPSDTDVTKVLMDVFLTWPKVYYVAFLSAVSRVSRSLLDRAIPPADREPEKQTMPDATAEFLQLVERRMNENEELATWMYREGDPNGDDGMGFSVGKTAGITYLTIFNDPKTLMRAMYADGSFPVATMDNLDSLHPWMVFDLITVHPHLTKVFPPRIMAKLRVETH